MTANEVEASLDQFADLYSGGKQRKSEAMGSYWQYTIKGNIYNLDRFKGFLAINRLARAGAPVVTREELVGLTGAPGSAFLHKRWGARQSFRASVGIDYKQFTPEQFQTLIAWVLENFGQKTEDLYISEKRVIDQCAATVGKEPTTRGTQRAPWSGRLRPDAWWEKEALVVEFHGPQHDGYVERFNNDPEAQANRDQRIRDLCVDQGLRLVEIYYEDRHDTEKITRLITKALQSAPGTLLSSRSD